MRRFSRYAWWAAAFAMLFVLALAFRQSDIDAMPSSEPIGDWSIVELAEHLKLMGVDARLRSTQESGAVGHNAFLTLTDKDWRSLNSLMKDPKHIDEWRGVLFCERVGERDATHLTEQWGEQCLAVGPFLFYGDTDLLHRVRAALVPSAAS